MLQKRVVGFKNEDLCKLISDSMDLISEEKDSPFLNKITNPEMELENFRRFLENFTRNLIPDSFHIVMEDFKLDSHLPGFIRIFICINTKDGKGPVLLNVDNNLFNTYKRIFTCYEYQEKDSVNDPELCKFTRLLSRKFSGYPGMTASLNSQNEVVLKFPKEFFDEFSDYLYLAMGLSEKEGL